MKNENDIKIEVSEAEVIRDSTKDELPVVITKQVPVSSYDLPDGNTITGDNLSIKYVYQTSIGQIKERLSFLYKQRDNTLSEIISLENSLNEVNKAVDTKIEESVKNGVIDAREANISASIESITVDTKEDIKI